MPSPDLTINEIIAKRWQIIQCLGEGTMSYVYQARDTETGKTIVVKHIKKSVLNNVTSLENLSIEIKQFVALNHENIASYYDTYFADEQLFLFCDHLRGESLETWLRRAGKLPLDKCAYLFQQIAAGLEYAHQNKIWHGDLRLSNIFIVNDEFNNDEPKIVDFGVMQLVDRASAENRQRTTTSHPIFGNAAYMSPEQRFGHNIDAGCDLYSLGCLMYEAACGKSPLTSKSAMETTYRQKSQNTTDLFKLLPPHPYLEKYQLITNNLLKAKPEERLKSAHWLKEDLDLLIRGKESDWLRQANVLKKSQYHFLVRHKWLLLGGLSVFSFLILFYCQMSPLLSYYFQPWHNDKIDENRLWLAQENIADKASPQLDLRQEVLKAKLGLISQSERTKSVVYQKNLLLLAKCLLACGQWDEAKTKFIELQNIASPAKLIDTLEFSADVALCQFKTGNIEAAQQSAQSILATPRSTPYYIDSKIIALKILGDIFTEKNEIAKAQGTYEQLYEFTKSYRLNKPAEFAYAAAVLADISRKEKKLSQSEALYKESIDWGENYIGHNQMFMAKAFYGLALVYYSQGNFREARRMLRQALPIVIVHRGLKNEFVVAINQFSDYLLFHQNFFAWCKRHWENAQ